MRRATLSFLACALATAIAPPTAAAQGRTAPGTPTDSRTPQDGLFERLAEQRPRLIVWPLATLVDGDRNQHRLDVRATWPAADTAPDFALHLLAGISSDRDTYSRSGLCIDVGGDLGPARVTGTAALSAGSGAGPGQAIALSLTAGRPALWLEFRSTWLDAGTTGTRRTRGDDALLPDLSQPAQPYDGRYTDAELNALQRVGPVALRLTGGQRVRGETDGTPRWLFGVADLPVWRRLGIVLAGGVRPERVDIAQPSGRFAQFGLRFDTHSARPPAPVPEPLPTPDVLSSTHAVVPLGTDRYLVRLLVPGARQVELKGDITDWTVVPLRRSHRGDDVWEITIHKPAGVYHVNIRVDGGEWIVPPGLVAVPDRFGGSAGVLTFPPTKEA